MTSEEEAVMTDLVTEVEELRRAVSTSRNPSYRPRPQTVHGMTTQIETSCGPLYVTVNRDADGTPFEVFLKLSKSGSCQQSYLEALALALSVGLRYGADPKKFVDKLRGIRCPLPKMRRGDTAAVLSCGDGVSQGLARALGAMFDSVEVMQPELANPVTSPRGLGAGLCPGCAGPVIAVSGCEACLQQCGWAGRCG